MPRKPKVERDEELDINAVNKKETFATRWFKDNAVNNAEDLKIICDITARSADEQFDMYIKSKNNEVFAIIFYGTFLTILDFLRQKQKTYNNFTIEIAKSVNIGYTNNDNEDNEKVGNFMPVMEYIGTNRTIVNDSSVSDDSSFVLNFIRWKELNGKKNIECYKEIQEVAYDRLVKEFRTRIRTSEAIIPLFCIFMDNVTSFLKFKFREAAGTDVSEVSMNVLGLFDVFYSFNEEDNQEIIEFQPNIRMKLALKSDDIASREN